MARRGAEYSDIDDEYERLVIVSTVLSGQGFTQTPEDLQRLAQESPDEYEATLQHVDAFLRERSQDRQRRRGQGSARPAREIARRIPSPRDRELGTYAAERIIDAL